jgi:Na+/melibiose symporter-like transporter
MANKFSLRPGSSRETLLDLNAKPSMTMRESLINEIRDINKGAKLIHDRSTIGIPIEEDPALNNSQRRILIASLLSLLTLQTLFLSGETIIPIYVDQNHNSLGTSQVALILVFTEVAGLLAGPLIGYLLEKYGRKNAYAIGFAAIAIGTAILGLTSFIQNDIAYLVVAIICRAI